MRAVDVMTPHVITVGPETPVQSLARLLCERGISGVPVVGPDEQLVGIVSEGDLLHRAETGTERRIEHRRARWLDIVASGKDLAREYVKSHGRKVKDVMTTNVISVADTMELADVATLPETKRIKRVPVVRDGKVVGIISRANLMRALAAAKSDPPAGVDSDDHTIRDKLLAELMAQEWFKVQQWFKIWAADVIVKDGAVHFWLSSDQTEEERRALRVAAESIAGVRRVEEHIAIAGRSPVGPSAAANSQRRQIGGDLADLLSRQIFRILVHDLVGPRHRRERFQLAGEIGLVLPGQKRDRTVAFCLLAVTGHASRHALGRNAFSEYLLAGGYLWRSAGFAGNRGLGSIVGGDAIDRGIAQSCGHAPHIGLRVWVGARLVAKGHELRDDIILLLAGEAREGRGDAATGGAVTRRADLHRAGYSRIRAAAFGGPCTAAPCDGERHQSKRCRDGGGPPPSLVVNHSSLHAIAPAVGSSECEPGIREEGVVVPSVATGAVEI
jgi:CBS domain-containing protein